MYMYLIIQPPIPITSPVTILNTTINSIYPPGKALVLNSDNSLSNFPPHLPSCSFPWCLLLEIVSQCHLYHVFTYIHALLTDKNLCECQNVLIIFPCALLFVSFSQRPLRFLGKFLLYSYFCVFSFRCFIQ